MLAKAGPVAIEVRRDRAGTFELVAVRKRQRRLGSIEDVALSLSAHGMTHGDISAHLADVYGSQVSGTTISMTTGEVLDGMAAWQGRPLDPAQSLVVVAKPTGRDSHAQQRVEQVIGCCQASLLRTGSPRTQRCGCFTGSGCVDELRFAVVY